VDRALTGDAEKGSADPQTSIFPSDDVEKSVKYQKKPAKSAQKHAMMTKNKYRFFLQKKAFFFDKTPGRR